MILKNTQNTLTAIAMLASLAVVSTGCSSDCDPNKEICSSSSLKPKANNGDKINTQTPVVNKPTTSSSSSAKSSSKSGEQAESSIDGAAIVATFDSEGNTTDATRDLIVNGILEKADALKSVVYAEADAAEEDYSAKLDEAIAARIARDEAVQAEEVPAGVVAPSDEEFPVSTQEDMPLFALPEEEVVAVEAPTQESVDALFAEVDRLADISAQLDSELSGKIDHIDIRTFDTLMDVYPAAEAKGFNGDKSLNQVMAIAYSHKDFEQSLAEFRASELSADIDAMNAKINDGQVEPKRSDSFNALLSNKQSYLASLDRRIGYLAEATQLPADKQDDELARLIDEANAPVIEVAPEAVETAEEVSSDASEEATETTEEVAPEASEEVTSEEVTSEVSPEAVETTEEVAPEASPEVTEPTEG